MKKFLLTTTALVAVAAAGSASAADLPVKAPVAPALVCPTCNWTGFYIGVNAGGSIGVDRSLDTLSGFPAGAGAVNPFLTVGDTRALPGGLGGAQFGYNWQSGSVVFGGEVDWQFSSERSTMTGTWGSLTGGGGLTISSSDEERIRSLGTARARLGWAHDGFLWFVTGGGAWANIQSNYTLTSNIPATTFASPDYVSLSTNRTGWTIGGGVETCLWNNWSAKIEYLYVNFGTYTNSFTTPVTAAGTYSPFSNSNSLDEHIIRVGVNYRFGGPVVARY